MQKTKTCVGEGLQGYLRVARNSQRRRLCDDEMESVSWIDGLDPGAAAVQHLPIPRPNFEGKDSETELSIGNFTTECALINLAADLCE